MRFRYTTRLRRRRRGFTLVELMVVIAIIGLLAAIVTVNVMGQMGEARRTKVDADMEQIGNALKLYKVNVGIYPQQLSGLWEAGDAGKRWKGPYLEEWPPKDPWDNEYVYEYRGGSEFEIISYGADGSPGGTDEAEDIYYSKRGQD